MLLLLCDMIPKMPWNAVDFAIALHDASDAQLKHAKLQHVDHSSKSTFMHTAARPPPCFALGAFDFNQQLQVAEDTGIIQDHHTD